MNKNFVFGGILIAIVIAIGAFVVALGAGHTSPQAGASGVTACNGGNCTNFTAVQTDKGYWIGSNQVMSSTTLTVGVTGTAAFYTVGGVQHAAVNIPFSATSSVPMIMTNPFGATTTIDSVVCRTSANGLTANFIVDLSTTTASGGYGSSTPALVGSHSVTGLTQDFLAWKPNATSSPSASNAGARILQANLDGSVGSFLGPTTSLTLRIGTSTPGTFSSYLTGSCSIDLTKGV